MADSPSWFQLQWQEEDPSTQTAETATEPAGRPYRSRKDRPCDACRKRKVFCDMPHGAPCTRCQRTEQTCTFLQRPKRRQRPASATTIHQYDRSPSFDHDWPPNNTYTMQTLLQLDQSSEIPVNAETFENELDNSQLESDSFQRLYFPPFEHEVFHHGFDQPLNEPASAPRQARPAQTVPQSDSVTSETNSVQSRSTSPTLQFFPSTQGSLESIPGAFSFYIGPTGASDAYLLRRQAFRENNYTKNVATGLKFRITESQECETRDSSDARTVPDPSLSSTIFGITDYAIIDNAEPRAEQSQIQRAESDFWAIIDQDTAWRLVRLYVRFIEPYFPVLAAEQLPNASDDLGKLSLPLLAGICAIAVPFAVYDEALYPLLPRPPSAQKLYRICWLALWQELHAPTLRTVQACLILQHRLPTNPVLSDTAFQWSLMSAAVSAAQTVGLHREPASWNLVPVHERKLRRRLWWALHTMEKWYALARGMPSHISEDDYDVEALDTQDLEGSLSMTTASQAHFENLVSLTTILSEVQRTFYTVRASKITSKNLRFSLEAARPLREKLGQWNERLPSNLKPRQRPSEQPRPDASGQQLDANASLHLSYIATHMTLFRALLRPLDQWSTVVKFHQQEAASMLDVARAVITGAIICVRELVEFVEGLTNVQWNAFWHSWSRPNFAIAGSFMIHLLYIITPPRSSQNSEGHHESDDFQPQLVELQTLIKRWRWANRMSANSVAGAKGLTNLALFKVETLLSSLGNNALPVNPS